MSDDEIKVLCDRFFSPTVGRNRLIQFARAIEKASRRAALEECWNICNVYADRLKGSKETASCHVALILTADEIRKLGRESIET